LKAGRRVPTHHLELNGVTIRRAAYIDGDGRLVYSVHMSDARENILACACELYLTDGLDGFSMRKLARQVGVTAPALYRHYESKEHVILDVVREAFREFTAYLYRGLEGRSPGERLMRAGEGYLDFALEHPRWYRMVFISPEQLGLDALPSDTEGGPEGSYMEVSLHEEVGKILSTLDEREREVVRLYFGIGEEVAHTLEDIGQRFNLTRERVRQIKEKAIRRLKHRSRSQHLVVYKP